MPKGRTKFQAKWLEDMELDCVYLKEWCSAAKDVYSARCMLCNEQFDISGAGFAQVRSHHKGKKHLLKFNARFKNNIVPTFLNINNEAEATVSNNNEELSQEFKIIKAETQWALRVAESNMSFKSCTDTVALFQDMFPDSPIAAQMKLGEKKVSYILTHGIAKHFEEELKSAISNSSSGITVAFDETTTLQIKRQLDLYVRFWAEDSNMVECRYLTSVFLGHATADILLTEMLDSLASFNIPLNRIVSLSRDNPNVNKSLFKKFNEVIQNETGRSMTTLGTCNLHVANNSFKKLIKSLEKEFNFEEFATDVHFYLKHSAPRTQDFLSMEQVTDETAQYLLKHVSSRWLSAGPVAQRLIDQWSNMTEYFTKFLLSQKSFSVSDQYIRIKNCLQNPLTLSFLSYIAYTHKHFENFSLCFQSEAPLVHILYPEINKLIRNLMMQFINDDEVASKEGRDLKNINIEDSKIWKKRSSMEVGVTVKKFLESVKDNEEKTFFLCIRSAVIETVKYMKINLPFCNDFLKSLQVFQPLPTDSKSIIDGLDSLTKVANYLKFPDDMINSIRDEWKLLKCDESALEMLEKNPQTRIDLYWRQIFTLKDIQGNYKFSNLRELIKYSLVLPHGNADPERGFSINKAMLNACHSDNTVKSLRMVKDVVKSYGGSKNVPITSSLLKAVKNSHKLYQQFLDKQKEEEQKLQKDVEKKEKEIAEKEKNTKRKLDLDEDINKNNDLIQKLKAEKEVAMGIITEGNQRLTTAINDKNNVVGLNVAHKLISEATDQLKIIEQQLAKVEREKDSLFQKRLKL